MSAGKPSSAETIRRWPLAVVGAGAAGLLAAIFAGRRGVPVLLLETRPRPGAKIRVSGGGRCNLLPSVVELEDYHTSGSMHAVRNVLFSWPLEQVRAFFERELRVPLKTEPSGKLFPVSERPQEVVEALLFEAARAGVTLRGGFRTSRVVPCADERGGGFELASASGETVAAQRIVLATGGLSLPKTGSDGGGLAIARDLGHEVAPLHPALVPLVTAEACWKSLAGVSLPVRIQALRRGETVEERVGDFLFTHRGFSGPVVLDVSRLVTAPGSDVELAATWGGGTCGAWEEAILGSGARTVGRAVRERLPKRLADLLLDAAGVAPAARASELSRDERTRLANVLGRFPLPIARSEGYATAEVTAGGIPLRDVVLRTLESRKVPGLHFAGEMLDVTGRIGGYNFLWAFVSGRRAGEGAAGSLRTAP